MNRKDVARIKKMLKGAQGKRLDQANAAQSDIPERLRNKDSRRAVSKLLASTLDSSIAKEFDSILAKDQAKLEAALKKSQAAAVKNSRGAQKVLDAAAAQSVTGLEAIADPQPTVGSPEYELLNTPFLIWPTNNIDLVDSEIVPSKSRAKFRVRTTDDQFFGDVKFYYLWSNPRDKFTVINVNGYIIFNGYCFVESSGGLFPSDSFASVTVRGGLQIFEWWNQPPTMQVGQPDQFVLAVSIDVSTSGWAEPGRVDSTHIFRAYDLSRTLMLVPPFGTVVFAVGAYVSCRTGDNSGLAEANFSRGAFQVGSPAVLVTMLS